MCFMSAAEQPMSHPMRKQTVRKGELHKDTGCADAGQVEEIESLDCAGQEHVEAAVKARKVQSEIAETNVIECTEAEKMDIKPEAQLNHKASRVQQQGNWKGVDPVLFLKDETLISSIISFYGIKEAFPLHGHLVTRSEDASRMKRIYYVSESVANVMRMNFRAGEQMKITSLGLKIFVSLVGSGFMYVVSESTKQGKSFC